jgi:hypothetical protein
LRASDSIIEALYSKVPVITNKHGVFAEALIVSILNLTIQEELAEKNGTLLGNKDKKR